MAIFKYEWRQLRTYTFWWSVACAVSIFLMLPVYLGFLSPDTLDFSLMANNPVFDLLGANPEIMTQPIGVFGFLTSFFAIAAGINGMFLGFKTFSKETIGRSAEFLYTKPYKRSGIFCAKVGAAVLSALITGLSYFIAAMVSGYMNIANGFNFGLFSLIAMSFLWVELFFVLFGALVGAVYPKIRTPLLFSSGVVFLFYIFSAFAGKVGADIIKFFTPFSWFGASLIVIGGGYKVGYVAAMVILCAIFAVAGRSLFIKKDTTLIS